MLFNINIGFTGLVNKDSSDSKGKDVALFVGDSVLVNDENDEKPTTILTPSKKKIKNIAIFLKDEDSDDEDEEKVTYYTKIECLEKGDLTLLYSNPILIDRVQLRIHFQNIIKQIINSKCILGKFTSRSHPVWTR